MTSYLRGNIHCHSTNSDGDSSPAAVAAMYARGGYDFCAITDHNHLTDPAEAASDEHDLVMIPGVEYSAHGSSAERKWIPMHSNGIGLSANLTISDSRDLHTVMRHAVQEIRAQHAFAMINHPNWHWALSADDIAACEGFHAVEIYNGSADCNNIGSPSRPSVEAMWDDLLTRGYRIWGVAADDAHHFDKPATPWSFGPFRGHVSVACDERSADAIVAALKAGAFYASTGVELEHCACDGSSYRVVAEDVKPPTDWWTSFIGAGGRELACIQGTDVSYQLRGDEGYVRARVCNSSGFCAWTQPHFIDD